MIVKWCVTWDRVHVTLLLYPAGYLVKPIRHYPFYHVTRVKASPSTVTEAKCWWLHHSVYDRYSCWKGLYMHNSSMELESGSKQGGGERDGLISAIELPWQMRRYIAQDQTVTCSTGTSMLYKQPIKSIRVYPWRDIVNASELRYALLLDKIYTNVWPETHRQFCVDMACREPWANLWPLRFGSKFKSIIAPGKNNFSDFS